MTGVKHNEKQACNFTVFEKAFAMPMEDKMKLMKQIKRFLNFYIAAIIMAVFLLAIQGCDNSNTCEPEPEPAPQQWATLFGFNADDNQFFIRTITDGGCSKVQ